MQLVIKDTKLIEAGVAKNDFDFGFVGGHLTGEEVDVQSWLTDQLVLIVDPTHPLARKRSVKAEDLRKEKFILREVGSATRATIVSHLENSNLPVETVMEMENPESVKKAVQSGLGIAFISKFAVETELKAKSLVAVPVRGLDIHRELRIVYRKDKHLGRAAQTFISMARQQFRKEQA
jgi:DNA-binding transcriptional LysR family regulator